MNLCAVVAIVACGAIVAVVVALAFAVGRWCGYHAKDAENLERMKTRYGI